MANNTKSLLLVLDLRKKEEDDALQRLSLSINKVRLLQSQIEQVEIYKQEYIKNLNFSDQQLINPIYINNYRSFIDKLEDILKKQLQELEILKLDEQRKREFYLLKQKNRKIIEKLLEKKRQEALKKELKAEQKLLDEYVVSHFGRKHNQ